MNAVPFQFCLFPVLLSVCVIERAGVWKEVGHWHRA